jgi:hypothetical protein
VPQVINIGDCTGALDQPVAVYSAGIGGAAGEDPCVPVGIEPTTWGDIKGMFR